MATARQKQLDTILHDMPTVHIECRDFGHSWIPFTVVALKGGGWERWRRCIRCETKRVDLLDRSGDYAVKPRYQYADGYLVKELGRLTGADRSMLRLASIMDMQARRK